MRRILPATVLGAVLALAAVPAAAGRQPIATQQEPGAAQGVQDHGDGLVVPANFDDASFDDLAVGAPGETVAGIAGAGAVSLFDGTATAPGREWLLHEGLANSGPVEAGDAFGAALGWYTVHPGGFLMTLVVGAPGRNRFGTDAGAVFPCYSYPRPGPALRPAPSPGRGRRGRGRRRPRGRRERRQLLHRRPELL
jgi:hypothetical protein